MPKRSYLRSTVRAESLVSRLYKLAEEVSTLYAVSAFRSPGTFTLSPHFDVQLNGVLGVISIVQMDSISQVEISVARVSDSSDTVADGEYVETVRAIFGPLLDAYRKGNQADPAELSHETIDQ